jgi:DNA polymerase eta
MRGDEAKALCPEFQTFNVDGKRGKADLTKYREASMKIFDILVKHCPNVEKASIDEAYLDLTDQVLERIRNGANNQVVLKDSYVVGSFSENEGK